jgi:hypothetical protein
MPPSIPDVQVCPLVEMKKTDNGLLEVAACNGIVWLHVPGLMTAEEVDAVKEASKMLPTTFATFTGADGRSVELLVAVAWKDDTPLPRQEPDIDRFLQAAYDVAFKIYSGILPKPIERRAAKARSGFRMTLDAAPYYHPQATPLTVQPLTTASTDDTAQDEDEIRESDMSLYAVYEQMYRRAGSPGYEQQARGRALPCLHHRTVAKPLRHGHPRGRGLPAPAQPPCLQERLS